MSTINPTISVIVPIYKVERFLPQCVDSILAQTLSDIEVILVDDGSPDRCPAICDEYAARDSRVSVIHQKNAGPSEARNAGIQRAKGEYLCFIDSDDILSVDYCETLLNAAVCTGAKVAACRIDRFSEEQSVALSRCAGYGGAEVMNNADFLRRQMNREIEIGVCNRLFHRSVFEAVSFRPGRRYEDIVFDADLLSIPDCSVAYLDIPLYFYRQQEESFMHQQANSVQCSPDRVFAGRYLLQCAKRRGYPYLEECFAYALEYPWSFVDSVYVHRAFRKNRQFLRELQAMIRENRELCRSSERIPQIRKKRMLLFAHSRILYGVNAYARLLRVYLYHVLKLDAYADGHGI
ncbi:MAG: glycosyltransferase [Clostridiales bacterium]|nr:glycosyltransferase [Clostridiales bacterium]MDY5514882.1 glycosyltransferase [Candidatus Ventricola sp.]